MGANGDASVMVIGSARDPQGVLHSDNPVIPDIPLRAIQVQGSSLPCLPCKSPTRARPTSRCQTRRET